MANVAGSVQIRGFGNYTQRQQCRGGQGMSEEGRLYVLRPSGDRKPVEPQPFPFPASKDGQQPFHSLDMWGKGTAQFLRDAAQPHPEGQGSLSSGLVSDTYQHKNVLITHEGGGVIRLKCPSRQASRKLPPRGEITRFSSSAARRFRIRLGEVLNVAFEQAVLTTMTYPEELNEELKDWEFYKGHLKAYWMAFRRKFPTASGFWKLEFQKNGRPHYHCIIFGLGLERSEEKLAAFIAWHSATWFRVVGSGLDKHLNAGTRAEFPKHTDAARNYISQYAAKQEQQCEGFTGRYWGQINKAAIPWAPQSHDVVPDCLAKVVRRFHRKKLQSEVKARRWHEALNRRGLYGRSFADDGWTALSLHCMNSQRKKEDAAVWRESRQKVVETKKSIITYKTGGGWHLANGNVGNSFDVVSTGAFLPRDFKWPKNYRPRINDSFVYLGNASRVRNDIMRYLKLISNDN